MPQQEHDLPQQEHDLIVRFPDEQARQHFRSALDDQLGLDLQHVEDAEFLPDVIIRGVTEEEERQLRELAGEDTRFFEDFEHDLF